MAKTPTRRPVRRPVRAPTRRPTLGYRLDASEVDALRQAADANDRKVAGLTALIVRGWLRDNGWMLPVAKPAGERTPSP